MSDAKYTWIKLYGEIIHDRKMAKLSDRLWRRAVEIMLLAGHEAEEGILPSLADMAWDLRCEEEDLQAELVALSESIGLAYDEKIGRWVLVNFTERQAALTSTERSRKLRGSNSARTSDPKNSKDAPPSSESALRLKNVAQPATKTLHKRCKVRNENVAEVDKSRLEVDKSRVEKKRTERDQTRPARATRGSPKGAGSAVGDSVLEGLAIIYAENVDELTPQAEYWIKSRAEEYGVAEVEFAIREAVMSNILNRRYMDAILVRRKEDRCPLRRPDPKELDPLPSSPKGLGEEVEKRELAERIIPPDPWAHLKDGVKTPRPGRTNLDSRYSGIRGQSVSNGRINR